MTDLYTTLEEMAAKATPGEWYTLGPPWIPGGSETSILAGSPDPHVATFICDFDLWAMDDEDRKSMCPDDDAELLVALKNALPQILSDHRDLKRALEEKEREVEHMRCRERLIQSDLSDAQATKIGWWNDMKRRGMSDDACYSAFAAARTALHGEKAGG